MRAAERLRQGLLRFCFTLLLLTSAAPDQLPASQGSTAPLDPPHRPFFVFDGTLYRSKPDLSVYGIRPVNIIYTGRLWPDKARMSDLPHEQTVRGLASEARAGSITILDVEHWPLRGDTSLVRENIKKYAQLIRWFRDEAPTVKLGYYGAPPIRDYRRAIGRSQVDYAAWQAENRKLTPLAKEQDLIFPSLYTFYPDRGGWVRYAVAQISEARQYGKPVYVFLWPQYHESNHLLRGQFIPAEYWALQLETAKAHADGIVIWGGWGDHRPSDWDDKAPWWLVTKKFMQRLTSSPSP